MKDVYVRKQAGININTNKIGQVRFKSAGSNVKHAKIATVISARVTAKRDNNNNIIEDSVSKIVTECVSSQILDTILAEGGDASDLATFTLEIVAEETVLKDIRLEDLVGQKIDLSKADIALKWQQHGNIGSWAGLKLILDNVYFANEDIHKK